MLQTAFKYNVVFFSFIFTITTVIFPFPHGIASGTFVAVNNFKIQRNGKQTISKMGTRPDTQ